MKATLLRTLAFAIVAWSAGEPIAAWDQRTVDVGGIPGQRIAISSATSRAYIPLLQQRALAVFDGERTSRLELDIKPTAVAYSAATGRLFVAGMFDNALVAIDEATGARTRIAVGSYPDLVVVDEVRGKVFVSNWGGIAAQGGVSVIDSHTLSVVRNIPLGGSVTAIVQDANTGHVFITGETPGASRGFLAELDSEGNVVARENDLGYQVYSIAVDSRNGRVYVAGLSGRPTQAIDRIFRVYSQPGLQLVTRHVWPAGPDWSKLNFMIDPAAPGLYFSSGQSTTLLWLDADGNDLRTWALPLGDTRFEDGRRVVNGIFGLDADPATGRIFVSSPVGSLVAEFDPATGATDVLGIPGAVGFNTVEFWPDSSRMLVLDAGAEFEVTLIHRSP
jgi:DNA-binding beta-propeller fold protein YncE